MGSGSGGDGPGRCLEALTAPRVPTDLVRCTRSRGNLGGCSSQLQEVLSWSPHGHSVCPWPSWGMQGNLRGGLGTRNNWEEKALQRDAVKSCFCRVSVLSPGAKRNQADLEGI